MRSVEDELKKADGVGVNILREATKELSFDGEENWNDSIFKEAIKLLKQGRINRFNFDDLLFYLIALGYEVEINAVKKIGA